MLAKKQTNKQDLATMPKQYCRRYHEQ